ncbi:hypothetical protein [Methylobacterium sp. B4]|uniref:hypothetical protein n=1 Tax=Methylobacterium sp. B4 TaxID=1938755 RepID=UPI0011B5F999|nr:hypothetical protein [Methylobacterium sp. B4]
MTAFVLSNCEGKIVPANQNQMFSRFDQGKIEDIAELKSHQPEVSDSAWYHDVAVWEENVQSSSEIR